jgi:hypothetical protein
MKMWIIPTVSKEFSKSLKEFLNLLINEYNLDESEYYVGKIILINTIK